MALLGRRQQRLDELVAELGADRVAVVAGDVADPEVNARLVEAARTRFGRLDSVVANAGIGAYGGIMSLTDDQIREIDATNFLGTVWSVRAAVPTFLEQGGGDVVIVSSVAGLRGGPWEAVYAGTKHAQIGLAGSLDRELREHGIRVTAICPAAVSTEFAIGAGRNEGDAWLEDVLTAEDVAAADRGHAGPAPPAADPAVGAARAWPRRAEAFDRSRAGRAARARQSEASVF